MTLSFDDRCNIKLYSPHREFMLSEIFHQKKTQKDSMFLMYQHLI